MNWKALIIDDEELARERLARMLKSYDNIEIIGEADNGQLALDLIVKLKPSLIFLDIEMPVLGGFQLLEKLDYPPRVVFTTAYDNYAIKAFEEGSIDYLLKPFEQDRLEKTIRRLERLNDDKQYIPLEGLLRQLQPKVTFKNLTVKIGDKILLIRLPEIIYLQAEDKYVFIFTLDGKKHLTDYTISGLDSRLDENFLQINRGTIINCNFIREIRKGFNGSKIFVMNNVAGSRLTSGRSYGEEIGKRLSL